MTHSASPRKENIPHILIYTNYLLKTKTYVRWLQKPVSIYNSNISINSVDIRLVKKIISKVRLDDYLWTTIMTQLQKNVTKQSIQNFKSTEWTNVYEWYNHYLQYNKIFNRLQSSWLTWQCCQTTYCQAGAWHQQHQISWKQKWHQHVTKQ